MRRNLIPNRNGDRLGAAALCALSLALMAGRSAAADTLSNNLTATAGGTESAAGSTWLAASFATGASAYTLDSVTLLLANTGSGQATAYIYTDGGLKPGSLAGTLVSPATYSSTLAQTTFTGGGISLSANTTYWVVLKAISGTFNWSWTSAIAGAGTGYTNVWGTTSDAGTTWYTYAVYPLQMLVSASTGSGGACTYSLSSTSASAVADGSSGTVTLTSSSGCGWSAASNATWITISSGASGNGSGTVSYTVAANTTTTERSGTIAIGGQTLTITQAAAATACSYVLAPTSATALSGTYSLSASVTTSSACVWTTVSNATWITVTSGASVTGSGAAGYTVAANTTNSQRSGTLTVAGQILTVTQLAVAAISCAEFSTGSDGRCMIRNLIPWVAFGSGWESRLKIGNISAGTTSGPIEVDFALLPTVASSNGIANHIPSYIQDNRTSGMRRIESASYSFAPAESAEVRFLYPPKCDVNGLNCADAADPSTLYTGSLQVTYLSTDPAYLRNLAKAQVTFLAANSSGVYTRQAAEREMPAAGTWKAPVSVSVNQSSNLGLVQTASAALANPGTMAVTVLATLTDQNGNAVTSRTFDVPALETIGTVFPWATTASWGGFGTAMFPQGQDFMGWVKFAVVSPTGGAINLVVLQNVGDSVATADVQSF